VWTDLSERHLVNCSAGNVTHTSSLRAPDALVSGAYWAPGLLSSFGLVGLNLISWEAVSEDSFGDTRVVACARIWVMASLIFIFSGFGTAIWCLVTDLNTPNGWHNAGVSTFVSNLLIMFAAFAFRLSRRSGEHSV